MESVLKENQKEDMLPLLYSIQEAETNTVIMSFCKLVKNANLFFYEFTRNRIPNYQRKLRKGVCNTFIIGWANPSLAWDICSSSPTI